MARGQVGCFHWPVPTAIAVLPPEGLEEVEHLVVVHSRVYRQFPG